MNIQILDPDPEKYTTKRDNKVSLNNNDKNNENRNCRVQIGMSSSTQSVPDSLLASVHMDNVTVHHGGETKWVREFIALDAARLAVSMAVGCVTLVGFEARFLLAATFVLAAVDNLAG